MAFKDIINKISSDACAKAEKIINEAKKEEEEILKKASQKGRVEADILFEQGKMAAEHRVQRMKQAAHIYARKLLLKSKQEVMETLFTRAENDLKSLPPKEYRSLMKKMALKASVTGHEEIMIAPSDKDILGNEWILNLNKKQSNNGKKRKLNFSSQKMKEKGGFILIRDNIHINCTFLSLIKSCRDQLEPQIAKILFPDN